MWNRVGSTVVRSAAVAEYSHPFLSAVSFALFMEFSKCLHVNARSKFYPGSDIQRFPVPDEKVDWTVPWADYKPVNYTAPSLLKQPLWADPQYRDESELKKCLEFNKMDGGVDRTSHMGKYSVINGFPRNPFGRTGLSGRGLLGRWGPNHATDPIVTRWKKEVGKVMIHSASGKNILQFVAICRKDSKEWAIPGGMVDVGEKLSATLKREFGEEALNSIQLSEADREKMKALMNILFQAGELVYKGYVDDPRNTDNSWMETVAVNFHDEKGDSVGKLNLQAGDDAGAVKWMDIEEGLKLYASHSHFLQQVAKMRSAHW
uniref:ADP-ribose pyrophosphatase, mitochondrial n=1 Tax=Callorhinchus milii TaxID=7868 RepID=V9L179_CALMI